MQRKKLTVLNFHSRFQDLVETSGLSQKDLAFALGLSEGSIVNYKRDRIPKAEELLSIAAHFGVSIEWLLTGQNPAPSQGSQSVWKLKAEHAEQKLAAVKSALSGLLKKI